MSKTKKRKLDELQGHSMILLKKEDGQFQEMPLPEAQELAAQTGGELIVLQAGNPPRCRIEGPKQATRPEEQALPISEAPSPLALVLQAFERETQPFRKVHRMVDAIEVLVKLHTVVIVSHWLERAHTSPELRGMLAMGLKTPSLGVWWMFAREISNVLRAEAVKACLPGLDQYVLKDGPLFKALEGQNNLIELRNRYAHGATPPDETCDADVRQYGPRLFKLAGQARHFRQTRLVAVLQDGRTMQSAGQELVLVEEAPPQLARGQCYLQAADGAWISLHPLLVFDESEGVFLFYNDLREKAVSMLNYERPLHQRSEPLRAALLSRYPLHEWGKDPGSLEPFRERIERLTESFKGREAQLERLMSFLGRDSGFFMVWGPPGVGKSALVARAVQVLGWSKEARRQTYPDLPEPESSLHIFEYFIRRGEGTDHADTMLEQLNRRLEIKFRTGLDLGSTTSDRKSRLHERIRKIAGRLPETERLVLFVDGLDEASDDLLLESLPKESMDRVLVVLASRETPRSQELYTVLDRERKEALTLAGLNEAETRWLLYDVTDKYSLRQDYVQLLMQRSEGNPLYLKLLCDGIMRLDYKPNDLDKVPESMSDLYKSLLARLAAVAGAHDLLRLLAVARDYLTTEAMAELMGCPAEIVETGPLKACLEVLHENPATENVLDYQLFHESLREHLRAAYPAATAKLSELLGDRCLTAWKDRDHPLRLYALRHVLDHLLASRLAALRAKNQELADRRQAEIVELIEDRSYSRDLFRATGHLTPFQRALVAVQGMMLEQGRAVTELPKFVQYTLRLHGEGSRLYAEQSRQMLEHGRQGNPSELAELALMGDLPQDRVMLILRALWQRRTTPELPALLQKKAGQWMDETQDSGLNAFWREIVGRT